MIPLSSFRPLVLSSLLFLAACGGPEGPPVRFTIPPSSGLSAVTDTLAAHRIVRAPGLFKLYARVQGAARRLKPGVYEVPRGSAWGAVLDKLVSGDVVKMRLVIPEGWTLRQIAARMATAGGISEDSVLAVLADSGAAARYGVPGPTLEGYLYPATYQFPLGSGPDRMAREMVRAYRQVWTPALRARAQAMGMSEREVVTLASIVEAEARHWSERPTIAAVYHNRLRRGMRLEADPTVQYALGGRRARLLYADIRSVADHPYNTYRRAGLPPGPIGSPSRGAVEAVLNPAPGDFLYFVARPNGTHVFTRTLAEHNAAKRAAQREARALARP
ncbi:MAG TPA: endolytic transglycosylase MltG [Longimicrobiaceae bacterium]|nr:endolytic transglycosylase MltG [Longimicrobiaceae bacterium]